MKLSDPDLMTAIQNKVTEDIDYRYLWWTAASMTVKFIYF